VTSARRATGTTIRCSQQRAASQQRSRKQDPPTRQTLAPPPRSASSKPAPTPAALLQLFETGEKTFNTAALVDPSTPTSSIGTSLASAFRLPTTKVRDEGIWTAFAMQDFATASQRRRLLLSDDGSHPRTRLHSLIFNDGYFYVGVFRTRNFFIKIFFYKKLF